MLEIDPTYSHSDLPNHWCDGLDPNYHLNKTQFASDSGYRCIHVFDWDDLDRIANLLVSQSSIHARKCRLEKISENIAHHFLAKYHIQGSARGAKYCYGLYSFNDELISVMTFGTPRYNRNYQWELLRLCSLPRIRVVGGASRMMQAFVKEVDPESIISYCDRAKFTGDVYYKLGFTLHHVSPPAKVWSKGQEHITDNLLRQRGFDQLFNANYGKGTSNEELIVKAGWRSVYDCGQLVFEWRNAKSL